MLAALDKEMGGVLSGNQPDPAIHAAELEKKVNTFKTQALAANKAGDKVNASRLAKEFKAAQEELKQWQAQHPQLATAKPVQVATKAPP